MLASGAPAVGASGAISGLMGLYLAIYPTNKISCLFVFFVRTRNFEIDGYILILLWFATNLFHAFDKQAQIAYWAHIGGFVSGFILGVICLKLNLIDRTDLDHPTVMNLLQKPKLG
jgi:membrane associated rhomboid family serine protease